MSIPRRDGRSTRWDPHRRERRRTIIDAAIVAIEEVGPDALTAQIAERANVPRTHVYRHFEGKEALDLAVSREISRRIAGQVRDGLHGGGTARILIRTAIDSYLTWLEDHPNLYRFLARHAYAVDSTGSTSADDAKAAFATEMTAMLTGYMTLLGVQSDWAEPAMVGVVGMVDASGAWWVERHDIGRDELTEALTDQAWLIFDRVTRAAGLSIDPETVVPPLPTPVGARR